MSSPNNAYKTHRDLSTTGATAETGILSCAVGLHRGGGVQLTGTFVGTVQFEETLDSGTNWIAKTVYPAGGGAGVTSATATGQWKFATGGSTNFRVRCSAFTSGPIVVDLTLTEGVDPVAALGEYGITWGAPTAVAVSAGPASTTLVAANANRKALSIWNPTSNAQMSVDIAGGTAVLATSRPILPGGTLDLSGAECPVGAITFIGTAGQSLVYQQGT